MSTTVDRRMKLGREIADFLEFMGEKKRANDIRGLVNSLAAMRGSNKVLHRHNMELRERLASTAK